MFDISCTHETPEGVDLSVDIAGPFVRTLAFAIDFLIRFAAFFILFIVVLIVSRGNELGWGVLLIVFFLVEWFYPLLFEYFRSGQTPGKKAMGIYVLNDDLTPLSFSSALTRNLLRAADFLPACYGFAYLSMFTSGRFQRLGDLAAGTVVAYKRDEQLEKLPESVQGVAPSVELNLLEATALVEFYLRENQLSQSRQEELAQIVNEPLNISRAGAASKLKLMGAWLLGARSED